MMRRKGKVGCGAESVYPHPKPEAELGSPAGVCVGGGGLTVCWE